jgi:hypothetical protein
MTFKEFNLKIQQQFDKMQTFKLFRLNVTGQQIWEMYLLGFKPEQNPIFRDPESSTMNCNNDKHFIRRYGNIVAIDNDLNIISIFDIDVQGTEYEDTIATLRQYISTSKIQDVFFETYDELNSLPYESCKKTQDKFQLGHVKTLKKYTQEEADKFGKVNTSDIYEFNHFHVFVNKKFVDQTGKSVESIMGNYRDNKNVFERGMKEIPLDTLLLVKDLIVQGSLLNGDAHLFKLDTIIPLKQQYDNVPTNQRDNWLWLSSYNLAIAKFRNELIGTFCVELAEGIELNQACITWNRRVDPANYMKAKAPITANQIKQAQQFVEDEGYTESFNRRFAILSDIDVSEIRHMNVNSKEVKQAGLFASIQPTVSTRHKRSQFDGIETISIDKFMSDVLPTCTSIEAFFENRMDNNLVVLTTANVKDSKPIFKWSNNYSWTYNGNLTGKSMIKEAVKSAGGKVDGILRFSITWNEEGKDDSDLDAHCQEPTKHIYYGDKLAVSGGNLDIDIRNPNGKLAVENITWPTLTKMRNGQYRFWVNQYSARNSQGFKAEIEMNGETFNYEYSQPVSNNVEVATVTLKDGVFSIQHKLPESHSNKNLWSLETNQFHKVNLVCLSPNHWATNNIGNKHYFFMLDGCKSDVPMRSFHNENLIGDLLEHRKVMEILADTTKLSPTNEQLAGLGFNATVNDELILKLNGTHKRTVKITF